MADKDTKKKATVLDMSKWAPMLEKYRHPFGPGAALTAIRVPAIRVAQHRRALVLVISPRDYGAASSLRYMDRSVRVKFMGGREVAAALCRRRPDMLCQGCCAPRAACPTPRIATRPPRPPRPPPPSVLAHAMPSRARAGRRGAQGL